MRRVLLFSIFALCLNANAKAQSSRPAMKAQATRAAATASPSPAAVQAARASFAKLPLSFEENVGQTDPRVKYMSRGSGYNLFLTADQAVFALRDGSAPANCTGISRKIAQDCAHPSSQRHEESVLWLKMVGANASAQILASDLLPGKINYYVGNDPGKWRIGVRQFGRVTYHGIYPGVNLTYYGNQQQLESDFVVAPGTSPRSIQFEVNGARETRIDAQGNLVLTTAVGEAHLLRPGVYQVVNGARRDLPGRYVLRGKNRIGFEVGRYDDRNPLVIDPVLTYSTYLGGSGGDTGNAVAIDAAGDAFVTGTGNSFDFPGSALSGPVAQTSPYAFVSKFDPSGNTLLYSTLLRGTTGFNDSGNGIGLDSSGNAYVAGVTSDADFPLLNPFQATIGDDPIQSNGGFIQSGFVAGLDTNGNLLYSTFFGGRNENDQNTLTGLAADASGNAYVTGYTNSLNFPTLVPFQSTNNGSQNAIVAKFSNQGQLIYSTYLGGNSTDQGNAIALDSSGNAYVTGSTFSSNFPVQTAPVFQATLSSGFGEDAFVSKISFNSGTQTLTLANSTFLGGDSTDTGLAIAVDKASPNPNVYVTGQTDSTNASGTPFPTQNPIFALHSGATEAFVTKMNGTFTALVYSTFLGGTGQGGSGNPGDSGLAIALDGANPPDAFVTGETNSTDFPLVAQLQSSIGSTTDPDAFVTEINGGGSAVNYSTYLGGLLADKGLGIAVDSTGNAYVTGSTLSANFPVSSGPFQQFLRTSSGNAFLTKISPGAAASNLNFFPPVFTYPATGINDTGLLETFTLSNNSASSVTINAPAIGGTNIADFTIVPAGTTCTNALLLAAGASCTVAVRFVPQDQDARSATLTVTGTSSTSASANLSGFGAVPEVSLSPATINYGTNMPLNVKAFGSVTITNTGGGTLHVGSLQITNAGSDASAFTINNQFSNCAAVPAHSSCFIEVDLTPTTAKAYSATLVINDDAAGSTQSVSLSGTAVAQVIVGPTPIEFGGWLKNTSSPDHGIFVENGSGAVITLSIATSGNIGDFPVDTASSNTFQPICANGLQLQPGVTCQLSVLFRPTAGTAFDGDTATYTFSWTGASGSPKAVTVMGTGETGVTLYQNTFTAPNEFVGATERQFDFDMIFNGTASPIQITSIVLSGANPQDFTVELDNSCSVNGVIDANSVCFLDGAFSPTGTGLRSVTATINFTGAAGSPLILNASGTGLAGPVQFPGAMDFGSQIVGLQGTVQRIVLQNTQKASLQISAVSAVGGTNSADFANLSSSTCKTGAAVPGGGKCYLDLQFTPGASGSRSASITITDNAPGSPRTLNMTGTGVSPSITVSPATLDFGNVALVNPSSSQPTVNATFYLTNAGNTSTKITVAPALTTASGVFAVSAGPGTTCTLNQAILPQGGTCAVVVTFKPTATGQVTDSVTLTDQVGGLHTVQIQGTGVNQGVLSVSGSSNFNQTAGTTSLAQTLTLTNTGTGPLTISAIAINGTSASQFAISGTGTTCAAGNTIPAAPGPGNTCTIAITFTAPAAPASLTANLLVSANLGNNASSNSTTKLTGSNQGLTLSAATPFDFGTVPVGTSVNFGTLINSFFGITITNNFASSVTITGIAPQTVGDFTVASNSCSFAISPNGTCEFDVAFNPSATTPEANNILISYTGAPGSPLSVPVKGTGSAALVAVPNPVNMTTVVGTPGNSTITIGNGTASTITLNSVNAITGTNAADFSIGAFSNCLFTPSLSPAGSAFGSSCTVSITFNPASPGAKTAQFTVTYNTSQTLTVTLNGTATAAQASITPASGTPLTFGLQLTNTQSLVLNVQVTNTGNAPLSFTSFAVTGTNADDFALASGSSGNSFLLTSAGVATNTACQNVFFQGLAPGATCVIPITFTPTLIYTGASRNATLTITDNAFPNNKQTVLLAGNAPNGNVAVSPTSLSYPDTNVGSLNTETVLVVNNTNATVTFTAGFVTFGTTSYSVDASQTSNACAASTHLPALSGSCTLYIKFAPGTVGAIPDTATIHTSAGSPTVALSGNGKSSVVSAGPNPLNFTPAQLVNTTSAPQTVTLTNATSASINITGTPTITGTNAADFALSSGGTCSGAVAGNGGICIVNITFTPKAAGARTATLTINASDANSPHIVTLNGTGVQPGASLSSATMSFGTLPLNATSTQQTVTVTNNGTAVLHISSVLLAGTNAGDFALVAPASGTDCRTAGTVAVSATCVVAATFTPTALNARSATITLTDDASPTTQTITLSGSGGAPSVSFNPTTIAFGNQRQNTTSVQMTSTLTNAGTVSLTITNVALGGTNSGDFTLVAPSSGTDCRTVGTIAANGTCVIAATFTPSATGARSATITFTDNSSPTTQVLNLTGTGTFPQATPTPSPLAFGNQRQNTTSAAQTLTLTNGGTGTLNLTTVVLGGTNANQFAIVGTGTTCTNGSTVQAGASCVVKVTFTPTGLGAQTATITFTDDASPTTQVVNVTGTGVFPQATPTPSPLAFGNQRQNTTSAAQTLTLTNGGTGTLNLTAVVLGGTNANQFAIVGTGTTCTNGSTVQAGASCVVKVTFTPTALGAQTATITFTDDASPTTQVVSVTGTGVFPQASPAPGTVPFGSQTNGITSGPQTITLTNGGTDVLHITTVALGGANAGAFAIVAGTTTCTNGGTVNPGSSCVVNVTFTPTGLSGFAATLTFTDDASPTTQVVNVTGTGVTSTVNFSPSPVAFGNQRQGVASTQLTTVLTNSGASTLTITNVTLGGTNPGDFLLVAPASGTDCRTVGTVAAAGSCTIAVTFTPTALGGRSATITVADNAAGSPHTAAVTGTGVFPQATPTPSPLAFANQIQGTTSTPLTVTLTNGGTDILHIATVALGGTNPADFAIATGTTCTNGSTVAAGNTCIVNLTFTPATANPFAATLTFTDDASPTTQTVNLSGTGVTPPTATLSAGSIAFGNQRVNTVSTAQNVTITNNGGAPLSVTSIAITGTNASDFAFASPATTCPTSVSGQVAPTASCTLSVTFDPAAANARSASITITVSGIANPAPITLTGSGIAPVATPTGTGAFGNQEVSTTSAALNGTLNNTGTDVMHITAVAITGANASDFSIVAAGTSCSTGLPTPVSVAAAANCTWSVKFTPTGLGSRTASLTFTDDSGATAGSTQTVALSGNGTAPVVQLAPTTVSFPAQAVSTTSAAISGTLTNTGTTTLHLATVAITGTNAGDFAIASGGTTCTNGSTVAPTNGTCTWSVTFTPSAAGSRTATLTFTDDNNGVSGSTQTVTLTGVTPPAATLSPNTPITFGNQGVGTTSSASSITVTNPGGSTLHIATVAISGTNAADFAVATTGTTCTNGSTVAPAASCTINLTFTPAAAGPRGPATLTVTDDASPATQTLSLSGTGISFSLSISTPPAPETAGTPITATIQLTPGTGGFPNAVTFSASNLPPDTTAAFSQTTLTPGTATVTTILTLTTTVRSGGNSSSTPPSHTPISGGWIATSLLALLAMLTMRRGLRMQKFAYLPLAVLLLSAAIITGCSTAPTGTPAGSYTVNVKATSGSYSQSTPVAITVK